MEGISISDIFNRFRIIGKANNMKFVFWSVPTFSTDVINGSASLQTLLDQTHHLSTPLQEVAVKQSGGSGEGSTSKTIVSSDKMEDGRTIRVDGCANHVVKRSKRASFNPGFHRIVNHRLHHRKESIHFINAGEGLFDLLRWRGDVKFESNHLVVELGRNNRKVDNKWVIGSAIDNIPGIVLGNVHIINLHFGNDRAKLPRILEQGQEQASVFAVNEIHLANAVNQSFIESVRTHSVGNGFSNINQIG